MREVLYQLISSHYTELLALWPMALLVIGLYIAVFIDPYIEKRERRIMLTVCTLVFSLVVENYLDYLLSVKITAVLFRKIVDIYGYSIRPVILLLFLCIVSKKKPDRKYWILVGANALICLGCVFTGIGKRRLDWVEKTFNAQNAADNELSLSPSLLMTPQYNLGLGATLSFSF